MSALSELSLAAHCGVRLPNERLPCSVNIQQSMNYDGIDLYTTNLLSQTIGSNTVQVCRAGVCSGTINF